MPSVQASIARLKPGLSEYLAMVRAGEEVVVTDQGRPVARLVPLARADAPESRGEELVRAGLARLPGRRSWWVSRGRSPEQTTVLRAVS